MAVTGRKTTEDIISSATSNRDNVKQQTPLNDDKPIDSQPVQQVIHKYYYQINAMDSKSFDKYISKNKQYVADSLKKHRRNFGV